MSRIEFTRIAARNFHSFVDYDLPVIPGKHLIIGENRSSGSANSNGSGKSSIWDSPIFNIYKKSTRGTDPSRNYEGNCWTMTEFIKDGYRWRSERYHKDKERKNELLLFQNDEDFSLRKKSSTADELALLIPYPYELFISSIVVVQGLPKNFTQLTPTIRKGLVEDMVGFNIWLDYREKFNGLHKESDLVRQQQEVSFNVLRLKMVQANTEIDTLKKTQNQAKDQLDEQVKEIQVALNNLNDQMNAITWHGEQCKLEYESKTGEGSQHSSDIRTGLTNAQRRFAEIQKIVHSKLCPTCGQNYPEAQIKEAFAEGEHAQAKIAKLQQSFNDAAAFEETVRKNSQDLYNLESQRGIYKSQLTGLFQRINQQEVAIDFNKMDQDLQGLVAEVNGLKYDLDETNTKLNHLKYLNELMLPSSAFRTFVLEKYISYINSLIDTIVPLLFEGVELKLVVAPKATGIELEIKRHNRVIHYESLSGGERKRLDIAVILAFQRFHIESAGVSTNLVVLDEIFDSLDVRGIENVMTCLDSLFPEDTAFYIITHNDSLKANFNSVIRVIKENDISRLCLDTMR